MNIFLKLFIAIPILLVFFCSQNQDMTGIPTEQGNPQIVAIVIDNSKKPVTHAMVRVYQMQLNTDTTVMPSAGILTAESETDSHGTCAFDNLIPGSYSLQATNADSTKAVVKTNIIITQSKPNKTQSDTLVLASLGSFSGIVTRQGASAIGNTILQDGFIQVKLGEIDRFTITNKNGAYSFVNLPVGTYTAFYYATDGFYSTKKENIIIRNDRDTIVDSVYLKSINISPQGFRGAYDTAKGTVTLQWQKVTYDSLRWYTVKRISESRLYDKSYNTKDTMLIDTLENILAGTVLDYTVCFVDKRLKESGNAMPIVTIEIK